MSEHLHRKTRIVTVIAATAISLACGTNYAYSAWAPQFAEKMQLSATQSNVIGTAANMGMYASGIPIGMLTDTRGPRLSALIGMVALALGYYPIRAAFLNGPGSMSVGMISLCSFVSGIGSCAAFSGALKTATLNWPQHRGTATAFPLSAFGLSAFFYTIIGQYVFPGNTAGYLLLLSLGTSGLVLVSIPFLRVVDHQPHTTYEVVPTVDERPRRNSNVLHHTKSNGSKYGGSSIPQPEPVDIDSPNIDTDESSSLMSAPGDIPTETDSNTETGSHSPWLDVKGWALVYHIEFYQQFLLMGLLTGVGLMTINNIGHDAQALWNHYDDSADKDFVEGRQLMHVSIISFMSMAGRLSSGIGSDFIVKRLHMSRFWCAAASATIFLVAQVCALRIENPNYLWAVSGVTGLGYGVLFGVFPAIVTDTFGPRGFATNWGFLTLAPVISGNIYNLCYGAIFDAHSVVQPGGERACYEGLSCYRSAYWITLLSSFLGILACLWGIRHEHVLKKRREAEREAHRDA